MTFKKAKEDMASLGIILEYRRTLCGMEYIFTYNGVQVKTHNRLGLDIAMGKIRGNEFHKRPLLEGID